MAPALLVERVTLGFAHVGLTGDRLVDGAVPARLGAALPPLRLAGAPVGGLAGQVQIRDALGSVESHQGDRLDVGDVGVGAEVDGQARVGASPLQQALGLDADRLGPIVGEVLKGHDFREGFERLRSRYARVGGEAFQIRGAAANRTRSYLPILRVKK